MTAAMSNRVLVLNKHWQPVNVTGVLNAIHKVWADRARFVDPETYQSFRFEEWIDNWADAIKESKIAASSTIPGAGFRLVRPSVIVCTHYDGFQSKPGRGKPKFSRTNLHRRDRGRCAYCNARHKASEMTLDHVVPKAQGGITSWTNIVLCCFACNQKKKDMRPEQVGMRLIRKPFVPTNQDVTVTPVERLIRKVGGRAPKSWEQFIGKACTADDALSYMYWSVELEQG